MLKFFIIALSFGVEPSATLHDDFEGTYKECKEQAQILTIQTNFEKTFTCVQVGDKY